MSAYVEECRQEWRRLGVPDLLAEEMATDLEADLAEAKADGVSAEEVVGESDPRRFAATWAKERGLVTEPPPARSRRRTWIWVAAFVLALVFVVVLGLFAATKVSVQTHVSPPQPQTVGEAVIPSFVGMKAPQALSLARGNGLDPVARLVSGRAGLVIAQAPAPGTRIRRGATVLLRIGRG